MTEWLHEMKVVERVAPIAEHPWCTKDASEGADVLALGRSVHSNGSGHSLRG